MHDSFLMQNIVESIKKICKDHNFVRVQAIELMVNWNSHITRAHLTEHLVELCHEYVDEDTMVILNYSDIQELTAKINYIEGEEAN